MKKPVTILLALTLLAMVGCSRKPESKKSFTAEVKAEYAVPKRVPVQIDGIGHFVAFNSAEIKAQVEGRLMELHFNEGQFVGEGEPLFTIDPRPFEAELEKVIAERVQMVSKLQYAAEKVARYQTLLPENYVSTLDYIKYKTDMINYEGAVMQKDAEIRLAEINLDYCYIKSPFNGITGKRLIDKGNLITNNGYTMLVVKQIDPIFIDFSLPERDFLKISRYCLHGRLNVEIEFPEHPDINFTAELMLMDNEIDTRTGMIPFRAQMRNPERIFWPGQFVRANLIVSHINNAVMVPESAVEIGQKGKYVYTIKGNKAEYRTVETGERINNMIHITKGVEADDLVVTSGQLSLRPHIDVKVINQPKKDEKEK